MDISLFLTKIMGTYFLVIGITILIKGKYFHKMMDEFVDSRYIQYFTGIFTFILGLLIVGSHNLWTGGLNVVLITIVGWLTMLKGALFLLLLKKQLAKFVKIFDNPTWYTVGGIVSIIIGIYFIYTWFTAIS